MDYELPAELKDLQARARRFVDEELIPIELETCRDAKIAPALRARLEAKAQEHGLWRLDVPAEFGGRGLGLLANVVVWSEMARTVALPPRGPGVLGPEVRPLLYELNPEQRERYLYPVLRGEKKACFAQTEPNAGTDPASMATSAVRDGDAYVINGSKWYIGHADIADFVQLVAVTDPVKRARGGISVFLVDMDSPGVSIVREIPTMFREKPYELRFENVRVPAANLVGEEGQGFGLAQGWITAGRVRHAARALGVIARCLELAATRALERRTFGAPLSERQAVQWMIVDMYQDLHTLRLTTYDTAARSERGEDVRRESYMCKYMGDEAAFKAADRCMQIYGALGLTTDLPIETFWREQRGFMITEGATEVLKTTLARHIFRDYANEKEERPARDA